MKTIFNLVLFFVSWSSLGASLSSELCKDIRMLGKSFRQADQEMRGISQAISGSLLNSLVKVNSYEEAVVYLKQRRRFVYTLDLRNDHLSRVLIDHKEISNWSSFKLAQKAKVVLWSKPSEQEKRNWIEFEKVELVGLSTLNYQFESNYYDLCHLGYPLIIQFELVYDRSKFFYEDLSGQYTTTFRLDDEFKTPLQVQQI